jgi:hypothetical protein
MSNPFPSKKANHEQQYSSRMSVGLLVDQVADASRAPEITVVPKLQQVYRQKRWFGTN